MRFAFFSKATLATLPHLFWKPDIILCNDWTSALVPLFYQQHFANEEFYHDIKTVLLIHSLSEYMQFSKEAFKNADLEISNDLKGSEINVFEAGAQAADHIIALDSPEEQVSTELVKLPGMQDVQSKVTAIKLEDNTPESYLKVASSIDLILQDLN